MKEVLRSHLAEPQEPLAGVWGSGGTEASSRRLSRNMSSGNWSDGPIGYFGGVGSLLVVDVLTKPPLGWAGNPTIFGIFHRPASYCD